MFRASKNPTSVLPIAMDACDFSAYYCRNFLTLCRCTVATLWPNSPDSGQRAPRPGLTAILRKAQTLTKATGAAIALATNRAAEIECCVRIGWTAPPLGRTLLEEDSLTAHCMRSGQRLLCDNAETDPGVAATALVDLGVRSLVLTPIRHEGQVVGVLTVFANVPDAFSALHLAQLDTAARDIADVLGGESGAEVTLSPRPLFTPEGEVIGATPPASAPSPLQETEAIAAPLDDDPQGQPEPALETPSTATHSFPTLEATARPSGSAGRKWILATVTLLLVAGGTIWIYPSVAKRLAPTSTAILPAASAAPEPAPAQPAGNARATLNIDPVAIVAQAGKTFALNVTISRVPDIASVAMEIDYEPNLVQFVTVAEVGPLAKDGQHVVLAHRDDPASGVLKISAQLPPGTVSVAGDGAVLSFVFRARRKGTASVSIAPGTRDSQGQSIDAAGSHASVTIN